MAYRDGIERIPQHISYNEPRPILVMVIDLQNNDEVVVEKRLDYSKLEDRKYLGQLTFWAITNHHSVETMAVSDAEPPMENRS